MLITLTALVSVMGGGCRGNGDASEANVQPFCDALVELRAQQAAWTPEALTSMTRTELVLNDAEQRNASLPVIVHLPPSFADDWIRVARASTAAKALVVNAWPESGSGQQLRAEAMAAGYDSISQYVLRDAFFVDGEPWTWRMLVEAGDEVRRLEDEACAR